MVYDGDNDCCDNNIDNDDNDIDNDDDNNNNDYDKEIIAILIMKIIIRMKILTTKMTNRGGTKYSITNCL